MLTINQKLKILDWAKSRTTKRTFDLLADLAMITGLALVLWVVTNPIFSIWQKVLFVGCGVCFLIELVIRHTNKDDGNNQKNHNKCLRYTHIQISCTCHLSEAVRPQIMERSMASSEL